MDRGEVPRDDVAAVLDACLEAPSTVNRIVEVVGGDVPIDEAVASL